MKLTKLVANGNKFDFYHKNSNLLFHAKVVDKIVYVTWENSDGTTYSIGNAIEQIEKGNWKLVGEKEVEAVKVIQIEGVDHHFSVLENGDVLVFRIKELSNAHYDLGYTTITQEEYDTINKLIDL